MEREKLHAAQAAGDVILANRLVMAAYETDVRPLLAKVRADMGRAPDPILAYREGGYVAKIAEERAGQGAGALGG
ncbi:MAG: hypothetical protein GY927_12490 [bacterium]|nr:hypothetical protein [bacterium]